MQILATFCYHQALKVKLFLIEYCVVPRNFWVSTVSGDTVEFQIKNVGNLLNSHPCEGTPPFWGNLFLSWYPVMFRWAETIILWQCLVLVVLWQFFITELLVSFCNIKPFLSFIFELLCFCIVWSKPRWKA